jgi:hypothetical protein
MSIVRSDNKRHGYFFHRLPSLGHVSFASVCRRVILKRGFVFSMRFVQHQSMEKYEV